MGDLGLQIDVKATCRKVDRYLKHDLEHYLRESGRHRTDISSPALSGMPSGSKDNVLERKIVAGAYASLVVDAVMATIANCDNDADFRRPNRTILTNYYFKGMTNWQVAQAIGYSERRYDQKKALALCEFADRFEYFKKVYHVEDQPKLQVQKSCGNVAVKLR